MARLPHVGANDLDLLGVAMPALRELKVTLTRGGSKYHLPRDEKRFRLGGGCRHQGLPEFAQPFPLMGVIGEICKRCYVTLPDAADVLWRTTALVAAHAAELERVRGAEEMRTWLGYARYAARLAPVEDALVEGELDRAAADASLAGDVAELRAAWRRLLADRASFLDSCADACPRIESFNGAQEAVTRAADTPELEACAEVSAAVGPASVSRGLPWSREAADVRAVVCSAWLQARSRGAGAARAAGVAHAAVSQLMEKCRVRDVAALPESTLPGGQFTSPAQWADAELGVWWPKVVAKACRRLEEEFDAEASASASRLLLINDWPLTHNSDAGVAYLAASPRFGPAVPYGYRPQGGYGGVLKTTATGPSYAVVITAPANIVDKLVADQDERISRFDPPRFQAGEVLSGTEPEPGAVEDLLRKAFPFLPGDAEQESGNVSQQVKEAREAQAAASAPLPEKRYERRELFRGGEYVWTPGRDGGPDLLEELLPYRSEYVRLDVECGRRDADPFLASLFGSVHPAGEHRLDFRAAGCHAPLPVPMHRVVAATGAPRWEPGGAFSRPADPLWQSYTAPETNRYRYGY
ncbi:hypothetical protein ACWDBD_19875 [Streptomyces sp. NPDC001118]